MKSPKKKRRIYLDSDGHDLESLTGMERQQVTGEILQSYERVLHT